MKLYDTVKELLVRYPQLRNSDKLLVWNVWGKLGFITQTTHVEGIILREDFLKAPPIESITRCRRKIQERYPTLQASQPVERARREKEKAKGTFVYNEDV